MTVRPIDLPEGVFHGTGYAYVYYYCRCGPCTKENRDRAARTKALRVAAPKDPADPRHGRVSFYTNHGCRCEACSAVHAAECKARARRRAAKR